MSPKSEAWVELATQETESSQALQKCSQQAKTALNNMSMMMRRRMTMKVTITVTIVMMVVAVAVVVVVGG